MAQPDYVPVTQADRVRTAEPVPPPKRWTASRPGEIRGLRPPVGSAFGSPGPDQGYALSLMERFRGRLVLQPGEHRADAEAAIVAVALKRASLFGRAPVPVDIELGAALFGFTGDAPADLVAWRQAHLAAISHRYWDQRAIADIVPDETLRLTPAAVAASVAAGNWKSLLLI